MENTHLLIVVFAISYFGWMLKKFWWAKAFLETKEVQW